MAAYVADLVGDDRVHGVSVYSSRRLHVEVPDPFHAATLASLLDLSGPHDVPAMVANEATGAGAHSYWAGQVRGVAVSVDSALRPGALPAPRPRDWPATADDVQAVA